MPNILIIVSNPKAQNDAFNANGGAAVGETYAAALIQCRDEATKLSEGAVVLAKNAHSAAWCASL